MAKQGKRAKERQGGAWLQGATMTLSDLGVEKTQSHRWRVRALTALFVSPSVR
jgi:hypothetical protein